MKRGRTQMKENKMTINNAISEATNPETGGPVNTTHKSFKRMIAAIRQAESDLMERFHMKDSEVQELTRENRELREEIERLRLQLRQHLLSDWKGRGLITQEAVGAIATEMGVAMPAEPVPHEMLDDGDLPEPVKERLAAIAEEPAEQTG